MADSVNKFSSFSVSDVKFSDLKKNKMGGKAIYLNSQAGNKLLFQLPQLKAPYGLSSFTDAATNKTTYSLDLSLDDQGVEQKFRELDDLVVDYVADRSQEFLGKVYKKDVIREALYKPLVKPSKGSYAPTLKLKVPTRPDGSFEPMAWTMDQKQTDLEKIGKSTMVYTIVNINSIWFIDNKFGVSVRLEQVLFSPSSKLTGFAFSGVESTTRAESTSGESEEVDVPEEEEVEDE
jgi:hypothetical protein